MPSSSLLFRLNIDRLETKTAGPVAALLGQLSQGKRRCQDTYLQGTIMVASMVASFAGKKKKKKEK
jgi:hypothetical protein